MKKQITLREVLESLTRAKGVEVFKSLREPKKWSELEKIVHGDKKSLNKRINEFISLGLVDSVLIKDTLKGSKAYVLTPLGLTVLQKLEELENLIKKHESSDVSEARKLAAEAEEGEVTPLGTKKVLR